MPVHNAIKTDRRAQILLADVSGAIEAIFFLDGERSELLWFQSSNLRLHHDKSAEHANSATQCERADEKQESSQQARSLSGNDIN